MRYTSRMAVLGVVFGVDGDVLVAHVGEEELRGGRAQARDPGLCRSPAPSCRRQSSQSARTRRPSQAAPPSTTSTPQRCRRAAGSDAPGHGRARRADDPAPSWGRPRACRSSPVVSRRWPARPSWPEPRPPPRRLRSRMIFVAPSPSATIMSAMRRSIASRARAQAAPARLRRAGLPRRRWRGRAPCRWCSSPRRPSPG